MTALSVCMCVINKPAKTAELAATTDIPKMTGKRMARTTCFRLEMRSFQENAINCTSPSAQCDDTCLPARSPMLSQRNRASLCSIPKAYYTAKGHAGYRAAKQACGLVYLWPMAAGHVAWRAWIRYTVLCVSHRMNSLTVSADLTGSVAASAAE